MNAAGAAGLLLLAGAGLLSACHHGDRPGPGPARAERRDVGSFDSVDLRGSARLVVTVGQPESLVLEGRASSIDRVRTEVRGDTLFIESKPRDWFMSSRHGRVTIKIGVPRLESLQVEGGNDVRLTGFDGGESSIRAAGAARIFAAGHLSELTVHMAGAARGDFSRLVADTARVVVEGVGSVVVNPKDALDATMNGVGAIYYTGSPREVNTSMNGLGAIARKDPRDVDVDDEQSEDSWDLQEDYEQPQRKPADDSIEVI